MWYSFQLLFSDRLGLLGQRKLLSSLVLVVGSGDIRSTLLPFLDASDVGCITVVNHNDAEVRNLCRKVIQTEGRRGTSKTRSACDDMRYLKPTALVTAVTDTFTWDNAM